MDKFYKPNLTSTRYRPKRTCLVDKSYLKSFYKKYPEYKDYTRPQLYSIIKKFNEKLWRTSLEHRDGIELPESLGYIFIGACPQAKGPNIDFAKSIKYGVRVSHKNWDTDGHIGKIFFSNYSAKYKLRERALWGFTACRTFKRTMTNVFKEEWKKFLFIENTYKVSQFYKKVSQKNYYDKLEKEKLNDYNEFDITD